MDVILQDEVRATILGNPDGLKPEDLRYIRRRIRQLVKNLTRKYEFLGQAMGTETYVKSDLNLEERRLRMVFRRVVNNEDRTEAVMDVSTDLLKPQTKKKLAALGLERDPDVPKRVVTLDGKIYRHSVDKQLPVQDLRIHKIPTSSADIFNTLVQSGFLKHPGNPNYVPLLDDDEPFEPLGRRERRALAKKPLLVLNEKQRAYTGLMLGKTYDNFKHRYGHLFDDMSYDYDTTERKFYLTLEVSKAFAGKGANRFTLQGSFELIWRNEGEDGTHLNLRITNGLSREFHDALKLAPAIEIDGKDRAAVSDKLFEILALSHKITVTDPYAARDIIKDMRLEKPCRDMRRYGHAAARERFRGEAQAIKKGILVFD